VGKSFSGRDGQPVRTRRSGAVAHANDADARWINGGGESRSSQPAFDAATNVGYILAVARVAPVRLGLEGKTMKKALMILGGIFVILVAFAILAIVVVAVKGNALDKESKQYADTAIRAVISQWDIGEIQSRASPEFKAAVKDDDLEKLGKMFRRLGNFKSYNGAKGQANMSVTTQNGKVISAAYIAKADFESGPAEIRLSLIKHGSQWQLLGLNINSRIFLEQP